MKNRIREFREKLGLTQKELAEKMRTTQQTIARWESGDSKPNIAVFKDLAFLFGTSLDYLTRDYGEILTPDRFRFLKESLKEPIGKFWGHFGVLPTNQKTSTWYPITESSYKKLSYHLKKPEIFTINCLNNKTLIINPKNVYRFVLNNDAEDSYFAEDFKLEWHSNSLYPLETYEIMEEIYFGMGTVAHTQTSKDLYEKVKNIIQSHQLTKDDLYDFISMVNIIFSEGETEKIHVVHYKKIAEIIDQIEMESFTGFGEYPANLVIGKENDTIYYPFINISVVEVPLVKIIHELQFTFLGIEKPYSF